MEKVEKIVFKEGNKVWVNYEDGHTRYKGIILGFQGNYVFINAEYAKVEFINKKYLTLAEVSE